MSSNDEVASLQESISNIKLEIENDVKSSTAFDADAMTMDQVSRCTVAVFFFFANSDKSLLQKEKVADFVTKCGEAKFSPQPDEITAIRFVSVRCFSIDRTLGLQGNSVFYLETDKQL